MMNKIIKPLAIPTQEGERGGMEKGRERYKI